MNFFRSLAFVCLATQNCIWKAHLYFCFLLTFYFAFYVRSCVIDRFQIFKTLNVQNLKETHLHMPHFHHDPYRTLADFVAAIPGIHSRVLCTTFCVSICCLVCLHFVFFSRKEHFSGSLSSLELICLISAYPLKIDGKLWRKQIGSCAHLTFLTYPNRSIPLINIQKLIKVHSLRKLKKKSKIADFQWICTNL